jgi:16S rRNA (cytidine1402-2'-O)-methyltransferase
MATIYLIPAILHEDGINAIPPSITEAIKSCQVFFVENERSTRRYFQTIMETVFARTGYHH